MLHADQTVYLFLTKKRLHFINCLATRVSLHNDKSLHSMLSSQYNAVVESVTRDMNSREYTESILQTSRTFVHWFVMRHAD